MAQAQVIAKVSSLSGEAYARDNAGKLRRLKAGDAIREGETVVAGDGAQVVLLLADGREMTVLPGETARLDAEVAALVKPDASDSAVVNNPDEFERIAKALATGGDLDALLEDPAAGVAGPGNEGHSFVEFLRVVESVDSLSYQFPAARIGTPEIIENPASPVSELGDANAPTANAGAGTPPTGSDAGYTLNEDTARTFAAGDFGFADADAGQTLQAVRIDSLPAAGNLTFNGVPAMVGQIIAAADLAQLVYTPGANASGAPYAGFDFSVQDSSGAFATTPNHITLTVAPIDDTSLLAPDSQTVAEDTVATGNVLANDSDLDNALDVTGFTVVGVAGSFNAGQTATIAGIGTLTIATNGDYSFTPLVDWNGTLPTATYTTNTGSTSTLDLSVTPVNDAPTPADPGNPAFDPAAGNYSVTTLEDTPVSGQVVGTDADGDPLTYAKCSDPANGTVTVNVDGTWTYTPGPNYNGNDSFMVTIADGHGGSATSTVFVGVTPVNDGPTPADPGNPAFDPATGNYNVTTPEDTPVSGQVLGTDSDGDPLTYAKGSDPANGTVMINADGTWTYTPGANYNGSDSFTVSIADGHGGSATSTVFVGVTPVNDGPTPADPGNPAFDPTTGNYNVTTPEDTPVSGQVVGADADGDLLTYAKGSDPANGTVSVNADGTWTYTPGPNYNGSDSFTVSIADGHGGSATSTVFVGVTPVNDGPTPADPGNPAFDPATGNYNVTTPEDTPVSGQVVGTDADGDALTYAKSSDPTNGTVTVNADGTWTYTPGANYNGSDSFTVSIADGHGGSTTSTVFIGVTPVDDASLLALDSQTVAEDTVATGNVLANDGDVDNALSVAGFTLAGVAGNFSAGQTASIAGIGTLTIAANGDYSFTPLANWNGTVPTASYTTNTGSTSTLDLTVTPLDDTPSVSDDGASTPEDTPVIIRVLDNDRDADGDALTITAIDGQPVAAGDTVAVANGTATLNADGTITFTPVSNYHGSATFTYTASDGRTPVSGDVNVTVTAVNDAPLAGNDSVTTAEDTPVTILVRANDSDADADPLTVTAFTNPANGTLTQNAQGNLVYTPNANFNGADSFTYTISDGQGGFDTATVTVNVGGSNDAPLANPDAGSTGEDATLVVSAANGVIQNDSDLDGDSLSVSGIAFGASTGTVGSPLVGAWGSLTLHADGSYTYVSNAAAQALDDGESRTDIFTYTVSDPGGLSSTTTLSLTVSGANDGPLAIDDARTTPEDTPVTIVVLGNDSDVDGEALHVSAIAGQPVTAGDSVAVTNGTATLNADGTITFTPAAGYNGPADFSYTITDGTTSDTANVHLVIDDVNDPPVALDNVVNGSEDSPVNFDPRSNDSDPDGDPLTITAIDGQPLDLAIPVTLSQGVVSLNADGTLTFTPNANVNGPVSFQYTIADGRGGSDTALVNLNIAAVDDPSTLVADTGTTPEDTALSGNVLTNDGDIDNSLAVASFAVSGVAGSFNAGQTATVAGIGAIALGANGDYSFAPAANWHGTVPTVSYTTNTGSSSTLAITVTSVDDAFADADEKVSVAEDTTLTGSVLTGTTSVDGLVTVSDFTVAGVAGSFTAGQTASIAGVGMLQINADGSYSFTPVANYNGAVPVATYTLSDGSSGDTSMLSITVTPVDDTFGDVNETVSVAEDTTLTGSVLTGTSSVDGPVTVSGFTVASIASGFTAGQTASIAGVGTLIIAADGGYSFTPAANYVGAVPVASYTLSDGSSSDTSTLAITVTPMDDAFTDADEAVSVAEDTALTGTVLNGTTSVDGPVTVSGFTVAGIPGSFTAGQTATSAGIGTLTIAADGSYTFTPAANYNGAVPVATYTLSDGSSGDTSTLSIAVTPVGDAFTDADESVSIAEDTTLNGTVLAGTTSVDGPVTVSGFTVAGISGSFTAGQTATIAGVGALQINADGSYSFAPAANYNGAVPVATYTLSDGSSGNMSTLSITVTPVNDNPLAVDDSNSVPINTATSGNVLANDSDLDGNPLSVTGFSVAGVAGSFTAGQTASIAGVGALQINGDGSYTFTPAANYAGAIPVATYAVSDGQGGTDSATLSLSMGNNAAPDARDDGPVGVTEDTPVSGNVLVNDSDPNGNPLSVTGFTVAGVAGSFAAGQAASIAGVGTLQINVDGSYSFAPAANYNGPLPIATYSITDGLGGTDSATLALGPVTSVNDAPC
ncbi:retention module-containing protein [Dechloromonas sp. A34]|uniref:retention module-containing protein n=1 Tax=Dechloromonas sp. A34 TaxID=447588 RepID=UPI002248AA8B|nr:retention module-containing protein [Dechloromonas sp. A34]